MYRCASENCYVYSVRTKAIDNNIYIVLPYILFVFNIKDGNTRESWCREREREWAPTHREQNFSVGGPPITMQLNNIKYILTNSLVIKIHSKCIYYCSRRVSVHRPRMKNDIIVFEMHLKSVRKVDLWAIITKRWLWMRVNEVARLCVCVVPLISISMLLRWSKAVSCMFFQQMQRWIVL